MGDPIREVERAIAQAQDCSRRADGIIAERDELRREVERRQGWVNEWRVKCEAVRAEVERLRATLDYARRLARAWKRLAKAHLADGRMYARGFADGADLIIAERGRAKRLAAVARAVVDHLGRGRDNRIIEAINALHEGDLDAD